MSSIFFLRNDWQEGKRGNREIQKLKYIENKAGFLDEIKSTFHNFLRAIIWWKKKEKWWTEALENLILLLEKEPNLPIVENSCFCFDCFHKRIAGFWELLLLLAKCIFINLYKFFSNFFIIKSTVSFKISFRILL